MKNTALEEGPEATPPRRGQYNGVETVLDFGDLAGELAALREQCGVFEPIWRTRISVTGKDRVRWLHNMVTNNVRDLPRSRGIYAFVLNAQGRILGDMFIFNRGESLLLDLDRQQAEPLITVLKRYIIMDKVEFQPSEDLRSIGVCGPRTDKILGAAGLESAGMEPLEIREQKLNGQDVILVRGPENKPGWHEAWAAEPVLNMIREKATAAGARPAGAGALEWWRILQGVPQYGQDIRDRDLPQETGQMQALCFTKGCYIGQEIVERIRSRGQVHRQFTGFEFLGEMPALGKHEVDGRALTEVTSGARIPIGEGEKKIGLGYIRREALAAGPEVNVGGQKARIVELPFTF